MVHVLAVIGPTASGKTRVSILLSEKMKIEIVSADSRQIYRYLDIGTAKPSPEELHRVPHHFISLIDPDKEYNASEYGLQSRLKIMEIFDRKYQPVLVGGSGLYIRSVIDGFFEGPGKNSELREQLELEAKRAGGEQLFEKLKKVDPVSASKMDATKVRRVIRALEVYYMTGRPISELHSDQESKPPFDVVQFGLDWERKELYDRIDRRVDEMIDKGFIEEVHDLIKKGYTRDINALNTVGYKEIFDFIEGRIPIEKMINLIKQNTRRFAKRQLTWFRADKRIHWIRVNETINWDEIACKIADQFKNIYST